MPRKLNLAIPVPCSEKWESFKSTPDGGYCDSCSKIVVDFTTMSDNEIIAYFKNQPANACGRFKTDQLKSYYVKDTSAVKPGFTLLKEGFVSFLLLIFSKQGLAQQKIGEVAIENVMNHNNNEHVLTTTIDKQASTQVSGTVMDGTDSTKVAGVTVRLKGRNIETFTDAGGYFVFQQPLQQGDILQFMFIGYESQEYVVRGEEKEDVQIFLDVETITLGGYIVGGVRATNRISFRRWWWNFRGLFN